MFARILKEPTLSMVTVIPFIVATSDTVVVPTITTDGKIGTIEYDVISTSDCGSGGYTTLASMILNLSPALYVKFVTKLFGNSIIGSFIVVEYSLAEVVDVLI